MKKAIGLWCVFIVLSGCSSLIQPNIKSGIFEIKQGNYQLDKKHATVLFKVNHLGFSKFIGRFNDFDASLVFDTKNFSNSKLSAVVNMESIDVNNKSFEKTLKNSQWLDVKRFPQARFETTSADIVSDNKAVFNGVLNFRGVTAPLAIKVTFNGGATNILTQKYTLGFEASGEFKRSDFGMGRYVPSIGDAIELEIHVEFQKK